MQVIDNEGHPDGKIPSHRAGSLYDITVPPLRAAHPVGQWNHARLRVEHGRIRQWLNGTRSEEHTSELQSLMRISYAVFCLKKTQTYSTYPIPNHSSNIQ